MFGHTFELIIILVVGLLIFGPKRVIEMGAAAGRMLRELRDAMKEMNWSALNGEEHGSDPLAELRDLPRTFASSILNPPPAPAAPPTSATPPATPTDTAAPAAPPTTTVVESTPPAAQNDSVPSGSAPHSGAPAEPAE